MLNDPEMIRAVVYEHFMHQIATFDIFGILGDMFAMVIPFLVFLALSRSFLRIFFPPAASLLDSLLEDLASDCKSLKDELCKKGGRGAS